MNTESAAGQDSARQTTRDPRRVRVEIETVLGVAPLDLRTLQYRKVIPEGLSNPFQVAPVHDRVSTKGKGGVS